MTRAAGARRHATAQLVVPTTGRPTALLSTVGCCALLVLRLDADWALPAYLYLAVLGVALANADLTQQRLPDALTLPAYPVTVGLLATATVLGSTTGSLPRALLGGAAMGAVYVGVRLVHPPGMGLGDVKLSGVLGIAAAWLGWSTWEVALVAPFLLGAVGSLLLMARRRARLRSQLPFGPYMLAGTLLAVLV